MAGAFDSSLLIPNSRHQSNGFGCSRAESPWSAQWPHVAQSLFEGRTNTTWLPPPSHVPNGIKYAFESARRDQCSEYDGDVAASSSLSSISRETRWPGQITVARLDPDIDGFHHPTMPTVPSSAPHLIWTTQAMTPSGKARPATLNRRASQSPANGLNQYFVPPPTSSANSVLSSQIKVDRYTPGPRTTRQPRQKPIFLSLQASIPVNQPWPLARQTMLSPASAQESLRQASSKRKLGVSGLDGDDFEAPNLSNGHAEISQHENRGKSSIPVIKREASEEKPSLPIPILPIPLPSKRFKKNSKSRAVLIPVEQLPVFALPPLPTIDDADLVKQVFSHQSLFERVRGRFEEPIDNPAKHYEKLEHVGDSILGMIVTTWLHETRPRLTCGSATASQSYRFRVSTDLGARYSKHTLCPMPPCLIFPGCTTSPNDSMAILIIFLCSVHRPMSEQL